MNEVIVETGSKKAVALEKTGASREKAYTAMVAALDAEGITVDKFGDEHRYEDHGARLKAAELISRLHGDLKETVVDNRTMSVTVNVSGEQLKTFMEMVQDVHKQLEELSTSGKQTGDVVDAKLVG